MPNYNLLDLMEKAVEGEDILKVQDDRDSLLDVAYQAVMEEVRRRGRAEVEM